VRAAVLNTERRFEVREVPDPEPAPGRLIVRVSACGICGSDLHMVEAGLLGPGTILGHEASGVVESVGEGVDGYRPGDPVAIFPLEPCGACDPCRAGAEGRCTGGLASAIGLGMAPGAFAERLDAGPVMLEKLPAAIDPALGAVVEPLAVALHGLQRAAFEPGSTVGVIGCGPIGLCAVLAARALGASDVWACDTNPFRAGLAGRVGAARTGSSPLEADVVVECAGAPGTLDMAAGSAVPGGKVVLLAVNLQPDTVYPFMWVTKEVDVVPGIAYNRAEFAQAARWVAEGTVDVSALVTRRVRLDDLDGAFYGLLAGAPEGKVLVTP
jgi:(R,R)-butanediol dehydrogenase/meso-butanediol dehydrogenase/diacetyl reductase